jgi:hypothetical protein
MLRRTVPLILFSMLVCSAAIGAANPNLLPVAVVKKLAPVELAGKTVEQAVWARPLSIPRFEYYVCDYVPTQQTEVRLAYDDQNLYVAFHCLEEDMKRCKTECTKRDDSVWKDDSVGIDLDIAHSHKFFHRLFANAAGVICDQDFAKEGLRAGDTSWDMDWSATASKAADGWNVLMTIPFKSLGVTTPKPGTMWGVNLTRRSVPAFERSTWATCRPAIQDLPAWGHFVFASDDSPIVYIQQSEENRNAEFFPCRDRAGGNVGKAATCIAVPGPHPMTVKILNPTSKPLPLRLDVLIDNKVNASHRTTATPGASDWNLKFEFPFEGLHELKFAVYDSKNNLLMAAPYQLVLVPAHRTRLARYRKMVAAEQPVSSSAKSEKADIEKSLDEIAAFARSARGNLAKWNTLGKKLDEVSMRIEHLRCACADKARLGYVIGTETALTKIMRDEMFDGQFGKPAMISLAKNEYESAQICVLAHDKALTGVQVSASDLKDANGNTIPKDRIKLNLVEWVDCKPARYGADLYGWTPDPLMDMAAFDVEKGKLRPVWITVHAPENTAAGAYSGSITIKPSNAPQTKVPLTVKVWNFAVPTKMHAKTAFAFFDYEFGAWYGKPLSQEQRLQWYDFLLQHHVSPTNIYSRNPVPSKEDFKFCADRGMNAFTLSCTWYKDEKELDEMAGWIRDWETYLKANNAWDMPYIYGFDELGPDKFQELRDTYGGIKKRFPDLPTMTTIAPQPELKGYVDYWVPLTSNYVHDWAEKFRKEGDQVWWYVCCHPYHPWPNYFVDYNAADPRILWWMSWKEDCPGILYYAINLWENNYKLEDKDAKPSNDWERAIAAGKRWPDIKWNTHTCAAFNGDGHLVYPGPNGAPIASIRLVSIRDGIEDYEYLYILDQLIKQKENDPSVNKSLISEAKKLAAIRKEVVASPSEYTTDPKLILGYRTELADMIQKLSK